MRPSALLAHWLKIEIYFNRAFDFGAENVFFYLSLFVRAHATCIYHRVDSLYGVLIPERSKTKSKAKKEKEKTTSNRWFGGTTHAGHCSCSDIESGTEGMRSLAFLYYYCIFFFHSVLLLFSHFAYAQIKWWIHNIGILLVGSLPLWLSLSLSPSLFVNKKMVSFLLLLQIFAMLLGFSLWPFVLILQSINTHNIWRRDLNRKATTDKSKPK